MSPTRSGYKELGLELVEPLQDQPRKSRRPPMADEKNVGNNTERGGESVLSNSFNKSSLFVL